MPEQSSFDYAVLRVVPRVEREEFVNAGVIVFCPERQFLEARIHVDESRLKALWPEIDIPLVREHLEAFPKICAGEAAAGPIARLTQRERFHWLVAPRSAIIQTSPVHTGLCDDPAAALDQLIERLVVLRCT